MKAMDSTAQSLNSSSVSVSNTQKHLKCIADKPAFQMCLNDKCTQKNVFQCVDEECPCQETHMKCKMGKFKPVVSMINSKISIAVPIKQAITQMITKKIDELSLLEESLHKQVDEEFKNGQLSELEQNFNSLFKGEKNSEFSSAHAKKIWNMATSETKQKDGILEEVNGFLKLFDKEIDKLGNELIEKINKLVHKRNYSAPNICREIMGKTAIITSEQLSQTLMGMFSKKVKSVELVFSASKNEFSLAKYQQVCGKMANTVIVCKTNMDKIIGAYTPLVHDEAPYDKQIEDVSGESFMFSLTDKQKFTLKNKTCAIWRYSNKSAINFGAGQFYIGDKSNQNNTCISKVNNANYNCPAYSVNDKAAYLKFHGNQTYYFSTKQWQVWKVEFTQS